MGRNGHTDLAVDAGYQVLGDFWHIFTAECIYTHEIQNLAGTSKLGEPKSRQTIADTKFIGGTTNYEEFGHSANGNDSIFLFSRLRSERNQLSSLRRVISSNDLAFAKL